MKTECPRCLRPLNKTTGYTTDHNPKSALASKLLNALHKLTKECVPHRCGGFTTDDMEWRMGTAFTGEEALSAALDELCESKLIRYAGYDEEDGIGHCYDLTASELIACRKL